MPQWRDMSSPRYTETVEAVSELRDRCRRSELTAEQFTVEVTDVFYDYLADEDPRDDVMSLVDYCVTVAESVCDLDLFADRVLPQRLDHQLRWILDQQSDGQSLTHLVRRLRARLEEGDVDARTELVELCQRGYETHQELFSAVDSEREIVELAHEFGVVAALDAAVRPTSAGRVAGEEKSRGMALPRALDLLAHLANDPMHEWGMAARDSLVDLCGYAETAGQSAIRIPVHLLNERQRSRLYEIYSQHEEAIGPEIVRIFISEQQLRDREIIRSALWQANDAARLPRASNATTS